MSGRLECLGGAAVGWVVIGLLNGWVVGLMWFSRPASRKSIIEQHPQPMRSTSSTNAITAYITNCLLRQHRPQHPVKFFNNNPHDAPQDHQQYISQLNGGRHNPHEAPQQHRTFPQSRQRHRNNPIGSRQRPTPDSTWLMAQWLMAESWLMSHGSCLIASIRPYGIN